MVESNSTSQIENERTTESVCKVCCENIKTGANKCVHCGSYQDWSRYIFRWTTIFISLLGIAPLWGMATSLYKIAFSSDYADIDAAIIGCKNSEIVVAYANSGKADGIVTGTNIEIMLGDNVIKSNYEVRAMKHASSIVISPKSPPVLVTYKPYISNVETLFVSSTINDPTCSLNVKVDWIDFKGTKSQIEQGCACP